VADNVHFDVGIAQLLAGQSGPDAAQDRADARDQLAGEKGLVT
jgi:hypothetical protein